MKPGRVVVLLAGRRAGKKAVIIKQSDEGRKKGHKFPHCLVAGIDSYPRKVTKRMGNKKIERKSKIRPFLKNVNFTHIMPTRYVLGPELDLKWSASDEEMEKPEERKKIKKEIRKTLEEKYATPSTTKDDKATSAEYFFKKLKF